jgi:hypothetical protein
MGSARRVCVSPFLHSADNAAAWMISRDLSCAKFRQSRIPLDGRGRREALRSLRNVHTRGSRLYNYILSS